MRARYVKVLDLMREPGVRYAIPVFQRSYTWGKAQCDELVRDCLKAAEGERVHFVGSILYTAEDGVRYVIDGQQRLATLTLLAEAMAERLTQTGSTLDGMSADDLRAALLFAGGAQKLTLSAVDNLTLAAILAGGEMPAYPSDQVIANLEFFRSLWDEASSPAGESAAAKKKDVVGAITECPLDKLWTGMCSLTAIAVELDEEDSAQDIFESLNSKGVHLTTADLCRNFLLVSLPHEEQTRIYEQCWEPIEDLFGDDPGSLKLNNAILGWLTIRFRRIRAKGDKQAFFVFKRYMLEEYDGTVESLLGELMNFSKVWAENYRYHPVKNYKSEGNWATLGPKTLVSGRPLKPASKEALEFYAKHFGIVMRQGE